MCVLCVTRIAFVFVALFDLVDLCFVFGCIVLWVLCLRFVVFDVRFALFV